MYESWIQIPPFSFVSMIKKKFNHVNTGWPIDKEIPSTNTLIYQPKNSVRTLAHSLQELGIYFYLRLRTFPTIEYLGFGHNLTPVFAKKKKHAHLPLIAK